MYKMQSAKKKTICMSECMLDEKTVMCGECPGNA